MGEGAACRNSPSTIPPSHSFDLEDYTFCYFLHETYWILSKWIFQKYLFNALWQEGMEADIIIYTWYDLDIYEIDKRQI